MRRRTFLSTALAGAAGGLAGCQWRNDDRSPSGGQGPPRLGVDGRWLVDPAGDRVVLRGVNVVDPWWGTSYADVRGKGYWETLRLATDADEGWNTRVLRVPVEPRSIREAGLETLLSEYLDRVVDLAAERDVYVLLDYHATERYDTDDIDRRVRRFWEAVAPRYAEDAHVLYELFNEPTRPSGNGIETWRAWREHAQPWVDLVREHAPDTPLVVGSPRWTSLPKYAPEEPFEGEHLLYSGHVYPSWDPETWEPTFGDPALDVPVFLTEWGYVNAEDERTDPHVLGSTSGWGEPFRRWLDGHRNVSWCARTFDSRAVPYMFDEDWTLLGGDDYMGEFTETWLADKRHDHWPVDTDVPVTTTSTGPPPTPTELRVTRAWPTRVEVAWDAADPVDVVVQYRVTVDDGDPVILRGTESSVTLSDLEPDTGYEVVLTAVNGRGDRSPPAAITVETSAPADAVATIPHAESPPTLDGEVDDQWADADAHGIDTLLWGAEVDTDLGGEWRALWDEDALYVLVSVTDGDAWADSDAAYQDDVVELYLDPDHSQGSAYDEVDDSQLTVRRGDGVIHPGTNSVPATEEMDSAQSETADGWRAEVAVPWSTADVAPMVGHKLGLDVHLVDDADGGDRDVKKAWFDTADDAWNTPAAFGTVELGE